MDALNSQVDALVNLAAESRVDRSITSADEFIRTNVLGTQVLLDCARARGVKRFVQVSTDEVMGSLAENHGLFFREDSRCSHDVLLSQVFDLMTLEASCDKTLSEINLRGGSAKCVLIQSAGKLGAWLSACSSSISRFVCVLVEKFVVSFQIGQIRVNHKSNQFFKGYRGPPAKLLSCLG
jgi:hypothetical protein